MALSGLETDNTASRFWSKVDKSGACWEWSARLRPDGYGQLEIKGKKVLAHRVAYILTYGEIQDGLCVCHSCDNPSCCNPSHLWLGTQSENIRDKKKKGRARGLLREANNNAKLTLKHAKEIRQLYYDGMRVPDIARGYEVHNTTILSIIHGRTWTKVGFCGFPVTGKGARGELHGNSKLTRQAVVEIRKQHAIGANLKTISSKYGVCKKTISNIILGRVWGWV